MNDNVYERIDELVKNEIADSNDSLYESAALLTITYKYISEIKDNNELIICNYNSERSKLRLDGYDAVDDDTITLYISDYGDNTFITKEEIDEYCSQLAAFFEESKEGLCKKLDDLTNEYQISEYIYENYTKIKNINFFIITNKLYENNVPFVYEKSKACVEVFDQKKFLELGIMHNDDLNSVIVDFKNEFNDALDFVKIESSECSKEEFDVYLLFIKGGYLAALYNKYRYVLLQGNVRAFLKRVNKKVDSTYGGGSVNANTGIYQTINEQPDYFASYNNGISAVASRIVLNEAGSKIESIEGLQIVNGGQTTATLHEAFMDGKFEELNKTFVAMKLTVIKKAINKELLISNIARFANTQNKVSESDLSSNEKYHFELEELSRKICVPKSIKKQEYEKWFYERIEGGYNLELSKRGNSFKVEFPSSNKFDKTTLAINVMSWEQEPYTAALGKQKCFVAFNSRVKANEGSYEMNQQYYENIVGCIILNRCVEQIISNRKFGGYKANILAYTISTLAKLTQNQLDLHKIWENQGIDSSLERIVKSIIEDVYALITDTPNNNKNVQMYCRTLECHNKIANYDFGLIIPQSLMSESSIHFAQFTTSVNKNGNRIDIDTISAQEWVQISVWGKETELIPGNERGMAYSMYKLRKDGKNPSNKQIDFAKSVLLHAYANGFEYKEEV